MDQMCKGSRLRLPLGHLPPQQGLTHVTGYAINSLAEALYYISTLDTALLKGIRISKILWLRHLSLDATWMDTVLRFAFITILRLTNPLFL